MNINANELLLLNKKIKFGQDGAKSADAVVVANPESTIPQAGMNTLMFQGMKNVASNPVLANRLNVMKDAGQENADDKAEYVAPYKSNLAFQGKAGKLKSAAAAAMMGLAALGTASSLTSCGEVPATYTNVSVTVDMSAMMDMIAELKALRQDLNNRDQQLAAKYDQLIAMFQQVITLMQEQSLSNETFKALVLANQDLIIDLMVDNGMKQDEANKKLTSILTALAQGQITLQEALAQLKELTTITSDIKNILNKALEDFNKYAEAMLAKQDELIATNKQGFEELIKRGDITNATLNKITEQNDSLIILGNQQIEAQNNIKNAIVKANLDSNANFDKVISTLNISKNQLIAVLMKLGYRQEQILKMTAGQIIEAIDNNTAVTKGTNMLLGVITRQLSILPEMLKQQKLTKEEISQLNAKVDALMEEVRNGNMTAEEFYNKALGFMLDNSINQRVIIYQLIQNGKTEAEANKLLQQLINEVKSGNKTAEEAFNEISTILGAINSNLEEIKNMLSDFKSTLNSYYEALLKEHKITNAEMAEMNSKLDALTNEVRNGNITAKEFYARAFAFMVDNSVNQRVIIYQLVKNGKTEAEANKLLQQLINEVKSGNKTAEAAFEEIKNILGDINTTLGEIKDILNGLSENFNKFYADYKSDKKQEMKLLTGIYKNGKFQSTVLVDIAKTQKSMNAKLTNIKSNTASLLEIVKDDTKFNELIQTIKDSQTTAVVDLDYDKLEQMFKSLGMDIKNVVNMSSSQIEKAIKDFQNTYIATEEKHSEEINNIQLGMTDLKIFLTSNNKDNKDIIDAINNLNTSVNQGQENVLDELKAITAALNKLQATVDAILKSMGDQAAKVDVYFQKWETKFDAALDGLEDFKSKLSTIIANQKTAEAYLNNLLTEVRNLKAEIQKIQNAAGGSNFSMEELEEMWQKHDAANYEKYSKLIKDLGLNQGSTVDFTTIEGLLASIDEKMDNIKDNSDILKQILNKLNGIDWSNPNYNAKLDQIIDLLKNFKCNCNCGNNNEGILGDLDDILG